MIPIFRFDVSKVVCIYFGDRELRGNIKQFRGQSLLGVFQILKIKGGVPFKGDVEFLKSRGSSHLGASLKIKGGGDPRASYAQL